MDGSKWNGMSGGMTAGVETRKVQDKWQSSKKTLERIAMGVDDKISSKTLEGTALSIKDTS